MFIVLGTILVVVILANIALNIMLSQSRLTNHEINRIRAYYSGLAGMNLALEHLRQDNWNYRETYCLRDPAKHSCDGIPAPNIIDDPTIPYETRITINDQGNSGNPNLPDVTAINIAVNYTTNTP